MSLSSRSVSATSTRPAVALQVLLATSDHSLAERIKDSLNASAPVIIHHVDDLAACAAELHEREFDVVLADAVTPGFDDPMLLRMARDTQSTALRVALMPEHEDVVPAARRDAALAMVAHFAVRPEGIDDLGPRVRSAALRQRVIESPIVRAQIAQCQVLPAAPTMYAQLATVLAMDDVSMQDIAEVVAQDPEVAARVLQLTNSAFSGRRRPTSVLRDAVAYVGAPTVRGLVLTLEVLRAFRSQASTTVARLAEQVAHHGTTVAQVALTIDPSNREGYTAGLLHDIGKLVLAANDEVAWQRVEMQITAGEDPLEAEQRVFGVTHCAVGAALLANWGLPVDLVEAVAFHHTPAELGDQMSLAGAVHIANALAYDRDPAARLDMAWVERAGLLGDLSRWMSDATEDADEPAV